MDRSGLAEAENVAATTPLPLLSEDSCESETANNFGRQWPSQQGNFLDIRHWQALKEYRQYRLNPQDAQAACKRMALRMLQYNLLEKQDVDVFDALPSGDWVMDMVRTFLWRLMQPGRGFGNFRMDESWIRMTQNQRKEANLPPLERGDFNYNVLNGGSVPDPIIGAGKNFEAPDDNMTQLRINLEVSHRFLTRCQCDEGEKPGKCHYSHPKPTTLNQLASPVYPLYFDFDAHMTITSYEHESCYFNKDWRGGGYKFWKFFSILIAEVVHIPADGFEICLFQCHGHESAKNEHKVSYHVIFRGVYVDHSMHGQIRMHVVDRLKELAEVAAQEAKDSSDISMLAGMAMECTGFNHKHLKKENDWVNVIDCTPVRAGTFRMVGTDKVKQDTNPVTGEKQPTKKFEGRPVIPDARLIFDQDINLCYTFKPSSHLLLYNHQQGETVPEEHLEEFLYWCCLGNIRSPVLKSEAENHNPVRPTPMKADPFHAKGETIDFDATENLTKKQLRERFPRKAIDVVICQGDGAIRSEFSFDENEDRWTSSDDYQFQGVVGIRTKSLTK